MCAIFGAVVGVTTPLGAKRINERMSLIMRESQQRGRDGWGYHVDEGHRIEQQYARRSVLRNDIWTDSEFFNTFRVMESGNLIGNMRAEPTTEYVAVKHEHDQQPYSLGKWTIVHNGTIANDKELRAHRKESLPTTIDSAAIVEALAHNDMSGCDVGMVAAYFERQMRVIRGSYAILATHADHNGFVFASCNYRPIWFAVDKLGTFFASSRDYFPSDLVPQMVPPYSTWAFTHDKRYRLDDELASKGRALVVCSGGLDSVVAAVMMLEGGWDVELLHFRYGSRAEGPEVAAVHAVAAQLGVKLHFVPIGIYDPADSPLLRADSTIAGGEAGAEFAHEWVPARNLVLLSIATAFAEAKGFNAIVLGNNLEEAGAYPDNEPEFVARFNDLLPHAVGDGVKLQVLMPVGNMMKHEIVAIGEKLNAPLGLTWSCYRAGPVHCGKCGPCYMRRTAYMINDLEDPLQYAKEA
jgi:7-cyano-7-deazaguanine synthase